MPSMTDPTGGLVSFQQALLDGEINLRPGELDPELFVHADQPTPGFSRLTYVRLDGRTVKAFVTAVSAGHIDGFPCFQLAQIRVNCRRAGCAHGTSMTTTATLMRSK